MIIANSFNRAEAYVELGTEDGVVVIPTDKFIAVDDESGFISVKLIGSRKTAYVIPKEVYDGE